LRRQRHGYSGFRWSDLHPYHDGKRTRFAIGYVGEDGIEAGVAYTVKNGKLVAA
jgi:hypothetical protein